MICLENVSRHDLNKKFLPRLLKIYEEKGKMFYYEHALEKSSIQLVKSNNERNIYYFLKRFFPDWSDFKLQKWSKRDYVSNNQEEQRANNFKQAIRYIDRNYEKFELLKSDLDNLVSLLSRGCDKNSYTKEKLYEINSTLMNPANTVNEVLKLYHRHMDDITNQKILVMIDLFVDLNNLKLYSKDNYEVSLIIFYAVLKNQFNVFKYVSFFEYLEQYNTDFKNSLVSASFNWDKGFSNTEQLHELIITILEKSNNEIFRLSHQFSFDDDLNKSDNIEGSILNGPQVFSKQDLRERHPNCSISTINRTLKLYI